MIVVFFHGENGSIPQTVEVMDVISLICKFFVVDQFSGHFHFHLWLLHIIFVATIHHTAAELGQVLYVLELPLVLC